ncbi:MAG: GNAT family N-acetyltransferase [Bacteroidota bacterium]|nr:GNAT family N-acetyltransferase [Bacteroidota bacterium]
MKNSRAEISVLQHEHAAVAQVKKRERSPQPAKVEKIPLEVNVITSETEFLSLHNAWEELVEKCPVHLYQTFAWQWFWWKHFGGKFQLHIVVFRRLGEVVGIIPLFLQNYSVKRTVLYRRLRMLGCGIASKYNRGLPAEYGPSDYLDAIVLPEYGEEVAKEFAAFLDVHRALFDEIHFQDVPPESTLCRYILPELKKAMWQCVSSEGERCPFLALPPSMDEYLDSHPAVRYRMNKAKKEFVGRPPYSVETIGSWPSFASAFLDLVHLHQVRWNRLGYAGLFSDYRFTRFQNDVLSALYKQGVLWFKAVRFAGVRFAVRVGFIFKGRCYDYLSGFDESVPGAKKSPSKALLLMMIENAMQNNVRVVDFLRGTEPYKYELATGVTRNVDIRVFNPQTRKTPRVTLYRLAHSVWKVGRRISDEWKLLSVQLQVHGTRKFLFTYTRLLAQRAAKKFFKNDNLPV